MVQLEFLCFGAELFIAHLNTSLMGQLYNDIIEFLLVRLTVVNGAAKAVYQTQLLLHSVGLVNALVMSYIVAVLPGFVATSKRCTSVSAYQKTGYSVLWDGVETLIARLLNICLTNALLNESPFLNFICEGEQASPPYRVTNCGN